MTDKPSLAERLVQSGELPWRAKSLNGVHETMRWRDAARGAR